MNYKIHQTADYISKVKRQTHKLLAQRSAKSWRTRYDTTARTAGVVIEYNARINSAYIDIPDLNGKKLKVSKSGRQVTYLHLSQSNKHIQQIYNDFSMYSGGRFYGGFWQGMPKQERARLFINDEPTIELDYFWMHKRSVFLAEIPDR